LRAATDVEGVINVVVRQATIQEQPQIYTGPAVMERQMTNFFEAEAAGVSLTKPWLRLERGLRLQKIRAYALAYPGLTVDEQEALNKMLVKANDTKLLNTKTQINYENGKILSIKGLKIVKSGDPNEPAVFKIDIPRPTKRNIEE